MGLPRMILKGALGATAIKTLFETFIAKKAVEQAKKQNKNDLNNYDIIQDKANETKDPRVYLKDKNNEETSNEKNDEFEKESSNITDKEVKQQLASIMPEVRKEFYGNVDKASKILAKDPIEMTKGDMTKEKIFAYNNPHHPKTNNMNQHLEKYFKVRYPGDVEYDATGRMIRSESVLPEPTDNAKYKDINGKLIDDGLNNILIKAALSSKSGNGVKNLQKTINSLHGVNVLKEDNDLGEKTATAVFDTIKELGSDKVEKAFDLTNRDNDDKFDLRYA